MPECWHNKTAFVSGLMNYIKEEDDKATVEISCSTGVVKALCGQDSQYSDGFTEVDIASDRCGTVALNCKINLGEGEIVEYVPVLPDDDVQLHLPVNIHTLCPTNTFIIIGVVVGVLLLVLLLLLLVGCWWWCKKKNGEKKGSVEEVEESLPLK